MKATRPTISFGILVLLAMALAGSAYYIENNYKAEPQRNLDCCGMKDTKDTADGESASNSQTTPSITENWTQYSSRDYFLSFKYPPTWTIQTYQRENYDIVVIEPKGGKDNIRIYITVDGYFGMTGLKTTPTKVGGATALSANDTVVGVLRNGRYYTFDAGLDMNLLPEFKAIIQTVAFR